MITKSTSLKELNTFSINALAKNVITVNTERELILLWQTYSKNNQPVLLLGVGSNILFLENFIGTVLINRIQGIYLREDNQSWYLHVGAGEIWNDVIIYSLKKEIPGLENLALIPGCAGAAPIQNIGAYGMEFHQICEYVDILNLYNGKKYRLDSGECQFSYRESIFKHRYRNNFAIVAIGIKLKKKWKPILDYSDLIHLNSYNVTPRQIFDTVCTVRRKKLPNPLLIGNAGSFFKNPILNIEEAKHFLFKYPNAPHYLQINNTIKLAAGWLIDHCQLKGYKIGHAAVHHDQALVLINLGQATGNDVISLANYVRQKVAEKFSIWLEPEVRFIASHGEVSASEVFL